MSSENLKKSLIEQQDLYGVPPIDIEPISNKDTPIQALYGVPSPNISTPFDPKMTTLYGPPEYFEKNNNNNRVKAVVGGTGIAFSIVLFIIGLIAMFNKKISKTAKLIIGISLAVVFVAILLIVVTTFIVF